MRLNGNTAAIGDTADPSEDVIEVDGKVLPRQPKHIYLMLHKPRGYVTTMHDEQGRKTAYSLVADCGQRVYPVGRLDINSEGLLLFTNDGAFANYLMHPSHEVEKTYLAWVSRFSAEKGNALAQMNQLEGESIYPAKVRLNWVKGEIALLEISIHEGKNRQVRRMCAQAGLTVTRLRRVSEGAVSLGELPAGTWRYLTENEVAALLGE